MYLRTTNNSGAIGKQTLVNFAVGQGIQVCADDDWAAAAQCYKIGRTHMQPAGNVMGKKYEKKAAA